MWGRGEGMEGWQRRDARVMVKGEGVESERLVTRALVGGGGCGGEGGGGGGGGRGGGGGGVWGGWGSHVDSV